MIKLNFGKDKQLQFLSEEEYCQALGSFCNSDAFTITLEDNSKRGSYTDAYRIRILAKARNILNSIQEATRTGGRINCNDYVASYGLASTTTSALFKQLCMKPD